MHGLKLVLAHEGLAPETTLTDPGDPSALLYVAMYRKCLNAAAPAVQIRAHESIANGNAEDDSDDWLAEALAATGRPVDDPVALALASDVVRRLPAAREALRMELVEKRDAAGAAEQAMKSASIRLAVLDVWPPQRSEGPTQQQLADQLGCAQAAIARAKAHIVKRLKELLGLDPADGQDQE